MANEVYANMMEVSCKAAAGKSICAFPDVCFTPPTAPPTPPGVPIPYPNTGFASDCSNGSRSVKITGKEVMLKNKSYFKKSTGDEAGSAPKKGVITSKITGKVYFTMWSMDVKVEGENVVRHLDMTTHNHASTPGNSLVTVYQDMLAALPPECANAKSEFESKCAGSEVKKVDGKTAVDCDDDCKKAQRCILVPKDQDKEFCCGKSTKDDERTGDHLIEVNCFGEESGRGGLSGQIASSKESGAQVRDRLAASGTNIPADGFSKFRPLNGDFDKYNPEKAPTVCVGENHANANHHALQSARDRQKRMHMKKRANQPNKELRGAVNDSEVSFWNYTEARDAGAKAHKEVFDHCDEECTKKQLDAYHVSKADIPPDAPVVTFLVLQKKK